MAQTLSTSAGHTGQVSFIAADGGFAKLLHDRTAILTWAFRPDIPANLKKGDRVTFDVAEYQTKGQVRRKAVNLQLAPELCIAEPKPEATNESGPKRRMFPIRAAKPALPEPSPEFTAKLANVEAPKKFHRI
jgi:hypothetical protein